MRSFKKHIAEAVKTCSCCDNAIDENGKCGCGSDCAHCGGQHNVDEGSYGSVNASKKYKKEDVELDEAVDKSSPVYKEYLSLKKMSIADLRKMLNQKGRGAVDLKGYDKQGAISDLLRGQFGSKKVAAAMGVAEGYDPTAKVSPEQKKKNIEAAKKRSKKTLPWQKNYDDRKRKEPGMNESKMSELQGYIDDGKSAAWIAKKIGFPVKDVKDFMKQYKTFSESEINNITAQYINENNIALQDLENMTEDELNELISEALQEVSLVEAAYTIKDGEVHISKANFRKIHKDLKDTKKGDEMMMIDGGKKGSIMAPVVFEETNK